MTGAVAAIIYGEPRLTNDVDIVIALAADGARHMQAAFSQTEYYVPPVEAIDEELGRPMHGHFKIIHLATSLKADFYPVGDDPLHHWALARSRQVVVGEETISVAPPEYVVIRKLEDLRAGGSEKHARDVQAMLRTVGNQLERDTILGEVKRLGLETEWQATSETGDA